MNCNELPISKHKIKHMEHSDRIFTRRKALFPSDDNSNDSDLGPMNPLSDDNLHFVHCQNQTDQQETTLQCFSLSNNSLHEYVIFENELVTHISDKNETATASPERNNLDTPEICYETPIKDSPTRNLKTPHESSNTIVKIPRMPRKNNLDMSSSSIDLDVSNNCFDETPPKLDTSFTKSSKVRTALFPEFDLTLPAKSFYSVSESSHNEQQQVKNPISQIERSNVDEKAAPLHLCRRKKKKTKSGFGTAGVKHSIRKPIHKKISKDKILQTALNILEKSPLNDYLQNIGLLSDGKHSQESEQKVTKESQNQTKEDEVTLDPTKKFFKSTKKQGIFTFNKNIKLQVSNDKISLMEDKKNKNKNKEILNASDLSVCESELYLQDSIANILKMLESDKENQEDVTKITNDRKRKCPEAESAEVLLSPTSQMCDMTSELAINSPKRARLNINKMLNISGKESTEVLKKDITEIKLFPIFRSSNKPEMRPTRPNKVTNTTKQWKPLPEDQLLLDAGQKRFGTTQCSECGIIYNMGDSNDEIMHLNYHNAEHILRFNGWKHENVIATSNGDRVIKVCPGDPKAWWKKVKDLMEVVNKDLGFCDTNMNIEKSVVFLYIKRKCIAGCLVAQSKSNAYKMLKSNGVDTCSEESYPIKCGISHIWVLQNYRKQGIGTALVNVLRMNFILGYILKNEDIAFSSPTEMGKLFASKYFKTSNYFIYMS